MHEVGRNYRLISTELAAYKNTYPFWRDPNPPEWTYMFILVDVRALLLCLEIKQYAKSTSCQDSYASAKFLTTDGQIVYFNVSSVNELDELDKIFEEVNA